MKLNFQQLKKTKLSYTQIFLLLNYRKSRIIWRIAMNWKKRKSLTTARRSLAQALISKRPWNNKFNSPSHSATKRTQSTAVRARLQLLVKRMRVMCKIRQRSFRMQRFIRQSCLIRKIKPYYKIIIWPIMRSLSNNHLIKRLRLKMTKIKLNKLCIKQIRQVIPKIKICQIIKLRRRSKIRLDLKTLIFRIFFLNVNSTWQIWLLRDLV